MAKFDDVAFVFSYSFSEKQQVVGPAYAAVNRSINGLMDSSTTIGKEII